MELLLIIALAGFAVWQGQRLERLSRRVADLERALLLIGAPAQPAPPRADEPLILDTPLAPGETEPLLLDTPLPASANDDGFEDTPEPAPAVAAAQAPEPELVLSTPAPALNEPPRAPPAKPRRGFDQWLAENALAYLGGGLLALGAIFLVAIAMQQSWFGPGARLIAASALGAALIGAGEYVRSKKAYALIAALLAGVGIVAFYATIWGAHALYGFIDWRGAAALLVLVSLALAALALRHGQPLGVLAIAMALMIPLFASMDDWPAPAVTYFVCAVGAAGFALAIWRRWSWVGAAALAGLYFWFAAALGADQLRRALALLSVASLGGVALAFRPALEGAEAARLPWARARALAPSVAIALSSVAMVWIWLLLAPRASASIAAPAWVGAMFVALAAVAVRARIAPPAVVAVAIGGLVGGFVLFAAGTYTPLNADFFPFILLSAMIVAGSAIAARPHRQSRALVAGAGAIGAALLTALGAATRPEWHSIAAWAPLFIGAGALLAAAWIAARDAQEASQSRAVDFWAGAAAVLILIGVESLFPAWMRAAAHASVALSFAAGAAWRNWRVLGFAALTAAAIAIFYALHNAGIVLGGVLPLDRALIVLGLAAGFLACGGYVAARRAPATLNGEALTSAAALIVLIAGFLGLRWLAAGGVGAGMDGFTEIALRALGLIGAGFILLPWPGQQLGRIGALRGHVLVGLGVVVAVLYLGLAFNPWWGAAPARMDGAPIFNPLLLAFALPGALLLLATRRLYPIMILPARLYAGAGALLGLFWALLECRRMFQGPAMAHGEAGAFEAACYALIILAAVLAIALAPRLIRRDTPLLRDLGASARGAAWAGLIVALFILLIVRHPWWGAQSAPSDLVQSGLAVFAHGVAVVMALLIGRALSVSRDVESTRFAAASAAALLGWSFGHALIRWIYHGQWMDDTQGFAGLEGFAHALWPLIYVLGAAALTARAPGRDTVRAYLYDLQALWSAAVWPAFVFAPLGLWLWVNPWWGLEPAFLTNPLAAVTAIAALALAAWLAAQAPRVPHLRAAPWMAKAARIVAIAHIFVALSLAVRAGFNAGTMAARNGVDSVEMWTYSAVWALYGAAVLTWGMLRSDAIVRWCGLAILFATVLKVFAFDMAQLSGVIRVASFLGLGAVLTMTALAMRKLGRAPAPPDPQELLRIIPSGRRGRPSARRRSSP